MSLTNSPTSTLSNFSNITDDNRPKNDCYGMEYFDLTNISKQTRYYEYSNGIYKLIYSKFYSAK